MGDGQSVLRVRDAAAQDRIDVYLKFGIFGQKFELLIQHFEAFLGNIIRFHVINADLQVFQAGAI